MQSAAQPAPAPLPASTPASYPGAPSPAVLERTWRSHARWLIAQQNLALWLDYFVPIFSGVTIACAVLVLAMRSLGGPAYVALVALPVITVLLMAGIWVYLRKRFDDTFAGLVQLDINCRLHNRLTAASAGIGPWPRVPAHLGLGAKWRWERVLLPVVFSLALLWAAQVVKVSPATPFRSKPTQQPMAWTQTESWLEALKEEQLVEEQTLDNFEAKMESLKNKDAEEWYSHGSLEAGDSLKSNLEKGMLDLQTYLKQAQELLESARATEGKMSEATLEKVESQYAEAMKGLQNGMLPLGNSLMEDLKQADPKGLSQMSQEQFKQMMDRMQSGQQSLSDAMGNGKPGEGEGDQLADMSGCSMKGKKGRHTVEGEEDGDGPGQGGVNRGRGDAPLSFQDNESNLGAGKTDNLKSENYDNALPGEMVGMSMTEPEVDPANLSGPGSSGGLISNGKGGEAVWRDSLTPEEREFLGRLYK